MQLLSSLLGVLVLAAAVGANEGADHWTYSDQSSWHCNASKLRQSPIDIETNNVVYQPDWRLDFVNYDQPVELKLKNTHHSVSLSPVSTELMPHIEVNWVPGGNEFELKEIHFHWGDGEHKGSEHEINNQRAAAEMHMVHYKKGLNASEIGSVENSIVVIGVFIETDNIEQNKLESLIASTTKVNGTDEECESDHPEHLINLLPDIRDSFFTYNGSLTTPPCFEVVTWVLMSQPVYLSEERLRELSHFSRVGALNDMENIGPNFRDIQPLLDRPVYSSFDPSSAISAQEISADNSTGSFHFAFDRFMPDIRRKIKVTLDRAFAAASRARSALKIRERIGLKPSKSTPS